MSGSRKLESHRNHFSKETIPGSDLWTDGLICAFEYVRGTRKTNRSRYGKGQVARKSVIKPGSGPDEVTHSDDNRETSVHSPDSIQFEMDADNHWVPIGWTRIQELVQMVRTDSGWELQPMEFANDEENLTVADVAAPYWERPAGPTWWCHVSPGHPSIDAWLSHAQWLHPAVSVALRDESRLISERMKHLFYEVPVRVAGGLLFELLGQSAGDPYSDEDDIPIVLRSWQAQNFLVTVMHIKGASLNINVLGITEVQELLYAGGSAAPKSVHEVIAHLASRLSRWDDRMFRKSIFGAADEIELKFVNRRSHEDLTLLSVILNQEIRRLSTQVIRVKWSLHAREEIVFELLQYLRGMTTRSVLEGIRKSTREMIEEQEAVRSRLFTIQDVVQSTVRAWLQDRSLRVTHNLAVFGGCGLVLSIITGLFGINVDGIPGAEQTPYAFGLFSAVLFVIGVILIGVGMIYLGLKKPITEEQVEVRKLELQELVAKFQHDAEQHAKVAQAPQRHNLPPTPADMLLENADYLVAYTR
ncbi:hypothetical protein H6P81_013677 [Aristolochia fimbriata]|uniref:Magnesium transporter CorA-like family protein n=1 Tax=Aristolochia fimbriata TaxID=158543 RepID=A0AAV7EH01_ARIFI|nr:hypothetical protein H6P81_013677 [Aristolochia fimbriata]